MILLLFVYGIIIMGAICGALIVIALASKNRNTDDVEEFYEAKKQCKHETYDEILNTCKRKTAEDGVTFFSLEDLEKMTMPKRHEVAEPS